MNRHEEINGTTSTRMQWGSYGFFAGILLGILMGWFFAGFVGAFIRVAIVALAIVPLVMLYIFWRKIVSPFLRPRVDQQYSGPVSVIETRAVVHGAVGEPQPR